MTVEARRVRIVTHTHSALYLQREGMMSIMRPGVTLRDCRLAIRVENLFTDVYLHKGWGIPSKASLSGQPRTMEELEAPSTTVHGSTTAT